MQIEIINPDPRVNADLFHKGIQVVFKGEHKAAEVVNVICMDHDELRALKKEYFGLDVYTDVIAFNLNDPAEAIDGEIYLSVDQIEQNSVLYKTELQNELVRVLIHGCLHLCGYEDNSPQLKAEMTALEDRYMAEIGIQES